MRVPLRLVALVVLCGLCAPVTATVGAQAATDVRPADSTASIAPIAPVAPVDSAMASSPTAAPSAEYIAPPPIVRLRAGVHARETPRPFAPVDQPLASPSSWGLGPARALMVVGVAALVAGAVIGGTPGTIVMVGGAVIGLIGLYNYLQ